MSKPNAAANRGEANVTQGPWAGLGAREEWKPRAFAGADKALIKRLHRVVSAQKLLEVLNERLLEDLGPDAAPYTLAQVAAEVESYGLVASSGPMDWPAVRAALGRAQRQGVLAEINDQTINDFAVVFSLNAKQVMVLKDIVLGSRSA